MTETQAAPVSQIVIEFGGQDHMAPTIRATSLSPAQMSVAVALLSAMCGNAWLTQIAASQARGIVPAGAGMIDQMGLRGMFPGSGRNRG